MFRTINLAERDGASGRGACLHHLLEAQAQRTPDAPAVACGGEEVSYRELNRRADRLALRLREAGLRGEALVGIYAERSVEMIAGLLGTLKAGGAYLPLDPAYPRERLAFMLADAGAGILLTQRHLLHAVPAERIQVICLDADADAGGPATAVRAPPTADDSRLAYVIYTSGSTGRPKGVQVSHRAVVNCLDALAQNPGLTGRDTVLALASLAFDLSVLEIFLPLALGARLVLLSREDAADGARLAEGLARTKATFITATPATWRLLLDAGWVPDPSLTMLSIGEPLTRGVADRLMARGASLWNTYGPTEATVLCSAARVSFGSAPISIGDPIAHTRMCIVDARLQPVPPGTGGELLIGGTCLARGYLGRPGLTAERFVPDPFSGEPGARLYRSGDRVRRGPDGSVEFLGRLDHQIKLRGFRIELGEIEQVLLEHPAVREAVVAACDDGAGDRQLVAYVVPVNGTMTSGALRDFLTARLPEYMVPAVFVPLDALPLTPNAKLDRRALPPPTWKRSEPGLYSPAPRSDTEIAVAGIWTEVLGIEAIGVADDFLALGGHSLKAAQVASRVREALQVELPVRSVFAHPTVESLAGLIERVRGEGASPRAPRVQPMPRDESLPLSFSQERAWFIQQLDPSCLAYHFQATLRFTGRLDPAVLERSLGEMVRRHEILRTSFPAVDGVPIQLIHEPFSPRLPVTDLQHLPAGRREAEAHRRIEEELQQPFDLTRLPLARWTLFRLAPEEFLLLHVEHHLVHDGWSFRVFLRELLQIYRAFAAGRPSPLPPPPVQFADVAVCQRRWMPGEESARQLAYWTRKLAGPLPVLALPTDRPRPAVQTYQGAAPRMELPLSLCRQARALSRQERATLFMTLLSAYALLLHRWSGQDEICVGSGVANRRWRETEGVLGMLVNNVVLRLDLAGDPSFRGLLDRVRGVALEAYDHEDLPFDQVVHALGPERDPSRNPLFQVMFSFHDAPFPEVELPGTRMDLTEVLSNGSAKFDLNVIVIPRAEDITVVWEYNRDLFDSATIERMMAHYRHLLEQAVAEPDRPQSELSVTTEAERRQLAAWNHTVISYPGQSTVHRLVAARAARAPDAVALTWGAEQLTYGELNRRANRLAHYLRSEGVGPDVPVAVCLERSPELVVALLGTLKAGGAYLPLDPGDPTDRLGFMLDDSGAPLLLTQRRLLQRLPARVPKTVCLDTDAAAMAGAPEDEPAGGVGADNLACVLFTSGSTGRPKGVEITHRNIVRLVCGGGYAELGPEEVLLQLAPVWFDAATFELWGALVSGARCVLCPGTAPAPRELGAVLERERVSTLWLTASLFNTVIDEAPEALSGVRQLLIGGEALSVPHVRSALRRLPGTRIINGYGPTESTTFACCHPVPRDLPAAASSIPIGRPIGNTEAFVLDRRLRQVPVGVVGELYLGGDGLARGYHRRPALTADRFTPHPFGTGQGERLYRTGDLARYLADGTLEFLGRADQQLKLRGHRIEPGEIEAALVRHPEVREAAVVMREAASGDKRLVSYVVPRRAPGPSGADLRDHLGAVLPDYMVPAAFVALEALPRTPSGKLDRRALPAPERVRPQLGNGYVAPRSPLESRLAEIWTSLLDVEPVGVHDNFFALGGHSLSATRVVSRLRSTFDVELPLRAIFEAPTIAGLATALARRLEGEPGPRPAPPIRPR